MGAVVEAVDYPSASGVERLAGGCTSTRRRARAIAVV